MLFVCIVHEKSYSRSHLPVTHKNPSQGISKKVINSNSPLAIQSLRADLYAINSDSSISLEDGNLELYDSSYCDCVNFLEDAKKMTNFLENFAIERDGQLLSIEKRKPVGITDTVFYNITQMEQKSYYILFTAVNLNHPNLFGFLQDSYTGTSTPVNLNGSTTVPFTITSDTASATPNRFQLVYITIPLLSGVTPVTYTSVKAWQQSNAVSVEWQMNNELNVSKYIVEKSTDGLAFDDAFTMEPSGKTSSTYNWMDLAPSTGKNFYRIEEIGTDGGVQYSIIMEVTMAENGSAVSVYPNPVVSGVIGLQMNNMASGNYIIKLLNNFGQLMFSKIINHNQENSTETISVNPTIVKGIYRLEIIHPDNSISNINVVF